MSRPLHFVERPGLAKARSLIGHLREAGVGEPALATSVLFIADGVHLRGYGRPLYGETWHRDAGGMPCVHGVVLGALSGRREGRLNPFAFDPDVVSGSDLDAVAEALAALRGASARLAAAADHAARREAFADVDACLRASPLWSDGPDGGPLDLLTPVRDRFGEAEADDRAFVIRHGAY